MGIRLKNKKKIALVLSGGGIKAAAYHVGVCLALKEKGFRFAGGSKDRVEKNFPHDDPMTIRLYVGSSAGAFVSSMLASGYSMEALINAFDVGSGRKPQYIDQNSLQALRPIRYRDLFSVNSRSILTSIPSALMNRSLGKGGFETFLKNRFKISGFFTTKNLEKYLRAYALPHNEFHQLGVELFIVGTQLNHTRKALFGPFAESSKTSRLMFINHAKISEAVACSTSLPPVFAPFHIRDPRGKEMAFFDGEIRDTLSTHVAADHGADLVISSYSVQPYHFSPEIGDLANYGIPVVVNQALYQVIQQKIDRHIQHHADIKAIYMAVDHFFRHHNLPEMERERLLETIRARTNFKPSVDYIYIHPRPQDHEMFFADHFNLNRKVLEAIVRIGFKSALSFLRAHDAT